jgi:hypothetical protein
MATRTPRAPQDHQPAKKATAPPRKTAPASRARAASAAALKATEAVATGPTSEDLAAEAAPVERPAAFPDCRPITAMPRARRADVFRIFERLLTRVSTIKPEALSAPTGDEEVDSAAALAALGRSDGSTFLAAADMMDILGDMEEILLAVAVDAEAMTAWCLAASDADLQQGWTWYQQVSPLGEASASPS